MSKNTEQKKDSHMDTSNDEIRLLEEQLAQAKKDAAPYVTEVLKDNNDEKVTRLSHGGNVTIRRDIRKLRSS